MEQTNQQITRKPSLPIKTKIAAWWIIVWAIISSGYHFLMFYKSLSLEYRGFIISPLSLLPFVFPSFIYLLIGIFLLKRKKMAWNAAVVISFIVFMGSLFGLGVVIFEKDLGSLDKLPFLQYFSMLIPFAFLLYDRKNFWEIAEPKEGYKTNWKHILILFILAVIVAVIALSVFF